MLYLHEIIDIVGTGQASYLKTVGERAHHSEREGLSRMMGTWKVIGSTNRWPRVVNLWEMDGWGQWAETLERQFLPGKVDTALAPWWAKATEWRSGGFDRILEPAAYSPDRAALQRAAILSNEKYRGVKLEISPGQLRIVAHNPEQEEAVEEIEAQTTVDGLSIGFNVTYLLDALSALREEQVSLNLRDANSSALVREAGHSRSRHVVMPLRL